MYNIKQCYTTVLRKNAQERRCEWYREREGVERERERGGEKWEDTFEKNQLQ